MFWRAMLAVVTLAVLCSACEGRSERSAAPDAAQPGEDEPAETGNVAQADEEPPELRSPWGEGAPDGHTYAGGSGSGSGSSSGYADPRNYHQGDSADAGKREHQAYGRYWLGQRTQEKIQREFSALRVEARRGKLRQIRGGTIDHQACVWTCGRAISESCQGIQALCAGASVLVLAPEVSIPCGTAIFAACIVGKWDSLALCDVLVCEDVQ